MQALDKLDRQILRKLQADGRATFDQIADQVGLSASAVLRRVRRLEEVGVIDRYVALVRPESVGLGLTAYVNVRLEKHAEGSKRNPMDVFRASVMGWHEVVECVALTGEDGHPAQAPQRAGLQDQFRDGPCQEHHSLAGLKGRPDA